MNCLELRVLEHQLVDLILSKMGYIGDKFRVEVIKLDESNRVKSVGRSKSLTVGGSINLVFSVKVVLDDTVNLMRYKNRSGRVSDEMLIDVSFIKTHCREVENAIRSYYISHGWSVEGIYVGTTMNMNREETIAEVTINLDYKV